MKQNKPCKHESITETYDPENGYDYEFKDISERNCPTCRFRKIDVQKDPCSKCKRYVVRSNWVKER